MRWSLPWGPGLAKLLSGYQCPTSPARSMPASFSDPKRTSPTTCSFSATAPHQVYFLARVQCNKGFNPDTASDRPQLAAMLRNVSDLALCAHI